MIHFTFRTPAGTTPLLVCAVALTMQDAIDLIEANLHIGALQVDHVRLALPADFMDPQTFLAAGVGQRPLIVDLEDLADESVLDPERRIEITKRFFLHHDGGPTGSRIQPGRLDIYDRTTGSRFRVMLGDGINYLIVAGRKESEDEYTDEDNGAN